MSAIRGTTPLVYILMGSPASGKGTVSQVLRAEGYDHLSIGDSIRDEVQHGNPIVLPYADDILNHRPIPPEILQNLVEQRLRTAIEERRGIIIDSYPKSVSQCEFLDRIIRAHGAEARTVCLLLDVLPENAMDRIIFRQVCDKCKRVFNSKFSPPQIADECDDCHEPLAKRIDDSAEGGVRRVQEFKKKIQPVLDYYAKCGRLHILDGNATPQASKESFSRFHQSQITKLESSNENWITWFFRSLQDCFGKKACA